MQQQLVEAQIALENDYDARREHEIRLKVLMESSDVATVFIALETGVISSCNSAAEVLLGRSRKELMDAAFALEFEDEGLTSLIDRMVTAASDVLDDCHFGQISAGRPVLPSQSHPVSRRNLANVAV